MTITEGIATMHRIGRCGACASLCDAWLCETCALSSYYVAARFHDDRQSSTATKISRSRQRRLERDTAHGVMMDLLSIPDDRTNLNVRTKHYNDGEGSGMGAIARDQRTRKMRAIGMYAAVGFGVEFPDHVGPGTPFPTLGNAGKRGMQAVRDQKAHPWRRGRRDRSKAKPR